MNFIKKVFDKKIDEPVHFYFQKFSKGEFRDRAFIYAKQSKGKYTIFTTAEFANEMVRSIAEKLGSEQTSVKGAIVTTENLDIEFKDKKQFQGVKRFLIENEMSGTEIIELLEKYPKAFFALTFNSKDSQLRIKPKAPKSRKPKSKKDGVQKPDFCKLITTDKELGQSFIFEKTDFEQAEVSHTYFITEMVLPKGETDFAKIRELAKRKGKIVRKALIDGEELNSESDLEA